jgi:hypothetical protein
MTQNQEIERKNIDYLDAPELWERAGAEPLERGEPDACVGEHHGVRRLALGDQLWLLLWAAMRTRSESFTQQRRQAPRSNFPRRSLC